MMNLLFLIPFTTAVVSAYFFQKTSQDIAYLTGTICAVSLLITLLIAPWEIQLIIISLAIIIARTGREKLQEQENYTQSIEPNDIKITPQKKEVNKYRGINYNLAPKTVTITLGKIEGKYRGNPLPSHQLSQTFMINHKPHLKYRGVDINSND
ncbi:conserved hypothetical protein [Gloeothece citriformis PCC 7424]|uniref:Uncharacterized protein n=1 Tax=Gloeothece citriformis (strain PCC 7424) TaxID=65393 RepID=B7KFM2_GLOC7|nr:DUF4278 domain-containing protein [Gloeothece citriformis]ACK73347.1 conserved hypothetical protein [Gloeothece citriformis PCC 7424]